MKPGTIDNERTPGSPESPSEQNNVKDNTSKTQPCQHQIPHTNIATVANN